MASGTQSDPGIEPIPYACQSITESDLECVRKALLSPSITRGKWVESFEAAVANACCAPEAVAVSNGTIALYLAMLAHGAGPHTHAICPAITFLATANAFLMCGAHLHYADVNAHNAQIDPGKLEDQIIAIRDAHPHADIMLASVSFAGDASHLPEIDKICKAHGVIHIEDAAHSLGATYTGPSSEVFHSGSCVHSDAAILSFHPAKHITTGEGGMVLMRDQSLIRKVRRLRNHGFLADDPRPFDLQEPWAYCQSELGTNAWMTDIQAALGLSQLRRLQSILERRRELAARYSEMLRDRPFSNCLSVLPYDPHHAYHLQLIQWKTPTLRRLAYEHFHRCGIRVQIHYVPLYRQPLQRQRVVSDAPLPGAESYYAGCMSLPLYPGLTDTQRDRVMDCLRVFCDQQTSG